MSAEPPAIRRAALLAWIFASLFFFYAFALRVSPSVMVDELMREFSVNALALGNLSAIYFYVYAAAQIPIGVVIDRVGPRRLLTAAALVCGIGCAVFALSETISGAYVGRFLIGLGAAFSWVGVLTIVAQTLPAKNFAMFIGGGQFAGTAGAIAGQAPLGFAIDAIGWRHSIAWLALLGVVIAACLWMTIRDAPRATVKRSLRADLRSAAANRQTWLLAGVGMSLTGSALAFAGLWGVPWFEAVHGVTRSTAAQLLSLVFVGWLIGAPLVGWISDRLQRRKPILLAGTFLSTLSLSMILYLPTLSLSAIAVLLFINGVSCSVMILAFAAGREHNTEHARGPALGIINTCVVASGALFQPLVGALLDHYWTGALVDGVRIYSPAAYAIAMVVIPIGGALGLLLAVIAREVPRS